MGRSTPIRARSPSCTTGAEMSEARLRMTRIPKGAELVLNKVSGAPGFWIVNVIVMAGVPSSCRRCSMR
jgi:molybdopterin-biosynthesis enzyme MoeA-like protein